MFNIGDIIEYGFYRDVEITDKDDKHYTIKDRKGNEKLVFIDLIEKYGKSKYPDS